jgi:hypothetical protein
MPGFFMTSPAGVRDAAAAMQTACCLHRGVIIEFLKVHHKNH